MLANHALFGLKRPPVIGPGETLDFSLRWTRFLEGALVQTLSVAVKGVVLVTDSLVGDITTAVVTAPGKATGYEAWIQFTITTNLSPELTVVRTLPLTVKRT